MLGLVGFGRIARHVARIAAGLGMRVAVFDPYLDASAVPAGTDRVDALDELLERADVVSVHVPLTATSAGMFGARQFGAMKPGAVFINTAWADWSTRTPCSMRSRADACSEPASTSRRRSPCRWDTRCWA